MRRSSYILALTIYLLYLVLDDTEIMIINTDENDDNSNNQEIIEIEIKDEDSQELQNSIQSITKG